MHTSEYIDIYIYILQYSRVILLVLLLIVG